MKVALCLSGQIRTFKECYPNIKRNILDHYNPVVFISTEDGNEYHGSFGKGVNSHSIEEIKELLKPAVINIVNDNTHIKVDNGKLDSNRVESCNVDRFAKDLSHRSIVSKSCQAYNENFDIVIRARLDLDIRSILPIVIQNGISIPTGQDWLDGINDQLAWGDPESMFWYMDLINHVLVYVDQGLRTHPEQMLRHHLATKSININRVPVDYGIKR